MYLIGRQDVQKLIDHVEQSNPKLISELLPDLVIALFIEF